MLQKKKFLHQLRRVSSLHSDHLIVAGPVVERVALLREVVHYVVLVEDWNPRTVEPRVVQQLGAVSLHLQAINYSKFTYIVPHI